MVWKRNPGMQNPACSHWSRRKQGALGDLELMLNEQIDAVVDQQAARAAKYGTFMVLFALGDSKSWCISEDDVGAFMSLNMIASRVVARAQHRIGAYTKLKENH